MSFKYDNRNFILNGKKTFLNSGEIHYFRIKKKLWKSHLEAAKEAGLTTVSTYVPWAWHEPAEGCFDLYGETCPETDLNHWLELCSELNMNCILKPGPFILAEWRGAGLPDWFLDNYGDEIKMHNSKGEKVMSDGVSLFHPTYQKYLTLWYEHIMPFIEKRQISKGGPVIMIQVCNEIGVFSWLAHQADYNDLVEARFKEFVKEKYSNIHMVNSIWKTDYTDYKDIELPPDSDIPYKFMGDRGRDYDWHIFWRKYYGDYLRLLAAKIRDLGIDVPLYHNLPGWIYGNGFEFPVNITMYEDLFNDKSEIIFGVDHIPEFVSYRNLHDDRIIDDITASMQVSKPLFAAEFQCGSREYHVVTNPRELELFYKASIANGLTGWNYYMFSQGKNPDRKGYSGSTFYWFNPLTPEAVRQSSYPLIKKMSRIIEVNEDIIVNAVRKAEICVLFYPPYYATELERPEIGNSKLTFNYSKIRRSAYFDGLLKAFQVLNIDYDMANLNKISSDKLLEYKQVWAFSTDEMNEASQQVLLDYINGGGNLIVFPKLPEREMNGNKCTLLKDTIAIEETGVENIDSPLVDILTFNDIKCANPQVVFSKKNLNPKDVIARNLNGHICAYKKNVGEGSVIHLGFWMGFDTENHKAVYESLISQSNAKLRNAQSDEEFLIVRQRFSDDGSGLLFIGNYYNEEHEGRISYTHPVSGEKINIPYIANSYVFPSLYGIITPLNLKLKNGLNLLHTTSDIQKIEKKRNEFQITLIADKDLPGELVLEGSLIHNIELIKLNNDKIDYKIVNERFILNYNHLSNLESLITIQFNEHTK